MEIKRGKNSLYIGKSEEDYDAIIQYEEVNKDLINITHTIVKKQLSGQEIGTNLVKALVEKAREEGLKISSICWFAEKVLLETEDYADVYKK